MRGVYDRLLVLTDSTEPLTVQPHTIPPGDFIQMSRYALPKDAGVGVLGDIVSELNLRPGQWRLDDTRSGASGRDIAQLRLVDPKTLAPLEPANSLLKPRGGSAQYDLDVDKYAAWSKGGTKYPPIEVAERGDGTLSVLFGRRRRDAAAQNGEPILAWVSPAVDSGAYYFGTKSPMKTTATYEAAVLSAHVRGDPVDPAIVNDIIAQVNNGKYQALRQRFPGLFNAMADTSGDLTASRISISPERGYATVLLDRGDNLAVRWSDGSESTVPRGEVTDVIRDSVYIRPDTEDAAARAGVQTDAQSEANQLMQAEIERRTAELESFGQSSLVGPTGSRTIARGPDPTQTFELRHRVVELDDLIASHDARGNPNPSYPTEVQPRGRDRAASLAQVQKIASEFVPEELIDDVRSIASGSPIIGNDRVIESGNGRIAAMRELVGVAPDKYDAYRSMLVNRASEFGVNSEEIAGMRHPVLVRERVLPTDRSEFARLANSSQSLAMSVSETARADAAIIPNSLLGGLEIGVEQSIEQALRSPKNARLVRMFMDALPQNEVAALTDASGNLSLSGTRRITAALFARTFPGEAGLRLTRTIFESTDSTVRTIAGGIMASLADIAKSESLVASGSRLHGLSIGEDLAKAIDKLSSLRSEGTKVTDYMAQIAMFGDELTPFQKQLVLDLSSMGRSQKRVREVVSEYARRVEALPDTRQGELFVNVLGQDKFSLWDESRRSVPSGPPGQTTFFQDSIGDEIRLPDGYKKIVSINDTSVTIENMDGTLSTIPMKPDGDPPLPPGVTADMGGRPMPTAEGMEDSMYKNLKPLLRNIEGGMVDDLGAPPIRGYEGLDDATRADLTRWVKDAQGKMGESNLLATKWGEYKRDAALLNYSRRYKYNTALGMVAPYEFWMTQSMLKWALHSIDRPNILAYYYRINKFFNTNTAEEGQPSRLKGKIKMPIPFLPDWMQGGVFTDPMKIGLPFQNWVYPWEDWAEGEGRVDGRAEKVLETMAQNGEITDAERESAVQSQSGDLWESAKNKAIEQDKSLQKDAFDLFSGVFGASLPLSWAYNGMRGTPERIGTLPVSRYIRALSVATGIGGPSGVNIEGAIRDRLGLPIFDQWTDYRIDRELSNMAAEGLISSDQAKEAMIARSGDIFDKASRREAEVAATKTLIGGAFGMPVDVYPDGEERQRNLAILNKAARLAEANGDTDALKEFFDKHPEYEARIALMDYDDPEKRLRSYLIDKIWGKWMELPYVYKTNVQDSFGSDFETMFLDKATQDYKSIPIETLREWAVTLGQQIPGAGPNDTRPLPIEWASPQVAVGVEQFYQARDATFNMDEIGALQSRYFEIPEDDKVPVSYPGKVKEFRNASVQQFPEIERKMKQYYSLPADQRRQFKKGNPEVGVYMQQLTEFKNANPELKKWFSDGVASSRTRSARGAFIDKNPELVQYWDWRKAYIAQSPQIQPFLDEQARRFKEKEAESTGGAVDFGPELNRVVTAYLFTGRPMSAAAKKRLNQYWENSGQQGSFEEWLLMMSAQQK
jgi:hypothetical protein